MDTVVIGHQSQQEPALLLAEKMRCRVLAAQMARQSVAQPAPGLGADFDGRLGKADLLVQLAEQRVLRGLAFEDAPLRELPRIVTANSASPKQSAGVVLDDDADIGPETVAVDVV